MSKSYFYTIEPIMQKVSRYDFEKFIKGYPRKLAKDIFGACDPPALSYNDFQIADKWPYSVVAKTFLYSDNKKDAYYKEENNRVYEIMQNYDEVFASKVEAQLNESDADIDIASLCRLNCSRRKVE